jgi:hypothetical protein
MSNIQTGSENIALRTVIKESCNVHFCCGKTLGAAVDLYIKVLVKCIYTEGLFVNSI